MVMDTSVENDKKTKLDFPLKISENFEMNGFHDVDGETILFQIFPWKIQMKKFYYIILVSSLDFVTQKKQIVIHRFLKF